MLSEIEQFIDRVRIRNPEAKTWRDYKCDLELFSRVVGDLAIQDIHPRQVDEFVNYQIEKGYKPSTVNRGLAAVVSFFRFLIAEGKADRCPVLPKRHYLREPERLPRPVPEGDLRKFFGSVHNVRDWAVFTLMLRCGLRIGEVSALNCQISTWGKLLPG